MIQSILKRNYMHIAITLDGISSWALENSKTLKEAYAISFKQINELVKVQLIKNIPILTINLLPDKKPIVEISEEFISFFNEIRKDSLINSKKVKISAIGKWYDLPGETVGAIKSALEATKDYDNFFLNFCINYDGQEEIVDACKMIARKIKSEKLGIDSITKSEIKDNIYASYFVPPDLMIKNGKKSTGGFLLWDSANTEIIFTEKQFPDFTADEFLTMIEKTSD